LFLASARATAPSFSSSLVGFFESGAGSPKRRLASIRGAVVEIDVVRKDRRVVVMFSTA
jgi:hypothetical protein